MGRLYCTTKELCKILYTCWQFIWRDYKLHWADPSASFFFFFSYLFQVHFFICISSFISVINFQFASSFFLLLPLLPPPHFPVLPHSIAFSLSIPPYRLFSHFLASLIFFPSSLPTLLDLAHPNITKIELFVRLIVSGSSSYFTFSSHFSFLFCLSLAVFLLLSPG